jgi:hypothetical protein
MKLMIDDLERRIMERRESSGSQQTTLENAAKANNGSGGKNPRGSKFIIDLYSFINQCIHTYIHVI